MSHNIHNRLPGDNEFPWERGSFLPQNPRDSLEESKERFNFDAADHDYFTDPNSISEDSSTEFVPPTNGFTDVNHTPLKVGQFVAHGRNVRDAVQGVLVGMNNQNGLMRIQTNKEGRTVFREVDSCTAVIPDGNLQLISEQTLLECARLEL